MEIMEIQDHQEYEELVVLREQLEILVLWDYKDVRATLEYQDSQDQEEIQAKKGSMGFLGQLVLQAQQEREGLQEAQVREVFKAYLEFQGKMECQAKMEILEFKVSPD